MVARTACAIDKGFVEPNKVLLLAYNKDLAVELEERINEKLSIANIPSEGIKASTFHALGLKIIAHATGRKSSSRPWVQNEKEIEGYLGSLGSFVLKMKTLNGICLDWFGVVQ